MTRTRFAVLAISFLVAAEARAWNALGHKTIAEIAWRQLKPEQHQPIVDAIRRHPRFDLDFMAKMEDAAAKGDKATQDHWIFLNAAAWPDAIRDNKEHDRPTWHYIALPQYLDLSDRRALAGKLRVNTSFDYPGTVPREKYNVVQAIALCQDTLRGNADPRVQGMAYCWLMHLVGDIHQPLHCVGLFSANQFPRGDKGGNAIPLKRGDDLHTVWDNLLGRQHFMRNVNRMVADLSDRQRYGEIWNTAKKESDVRKWAEESCALCESFVYSDVILEAVRSTPKDMPLQPLDLPESYYKAAGEQARRRIVMAGLRLSVILDGLNR
jgi:hypothetical protein